MFWAGRAASEKALKWEQACIQVKARRPMGWRQVRNPGDEVNSGGRQAAPVAKGRTLDLMLVFGEAINGQAYLTRAATQRGKGKF